MEWNTWLCMPQLHSLLMFEIHMLKPYNPFFQTILHYALHTELGVVVLAG